MSNNTELNYPIRKNSDYAQKEDKTYLAFISYSHEDKEHAVWLQQKLESFRLPLYLQEQRPDLPDYPRPIFRDETDLELGPLSENIHRALDLSHYLIVICSPRVIKSIYVQDEIRYFKRHYGHKRIIPFIIDGSPFSDNPDTECFPKEIKDLPENLAANINELGMDYAVVKIIARMLNLKIDELWQRYRIAEDQEKKRQKEEQDKLLRIQSYYLAEKSVMIHQTKKYDLARRLALLALPHNPELNERPYVAEADNAFRLSYASFRYIFYGNNGCVSPNGEWVAVVTGTSPDNIILYHANTGNAVHHFPIYGCVLSVSFSCDSKTIACGTRDGTIYMWDIASETCEGKLEIGFAVVAIAFSPDMKHLMASLHKYNYQRKKITSLDNINNSIITVSLYPLKFELEWKLGEFEVAQKLEFSNTGQYLVSFIDNNAYIQNTCTGEIIESELNVKHISFSKDDRYHVYGFGHCMPFVDSLDNKHTRVYKYRDVSFASFCGSTNLIMSICNDYVVRIWRCLEDDFELISILKGHLDSIKWLTANNKGDLVATCSQDNTVRVWSVKDKRCISMVHCEDPEKIHFLTNEQLIAITSKNSIRLWEYMEDRSNIKLDGHHEGVVSTFCSNDNTILLSGSSNAELFLWDLKNRSRKRVEISILNGKHSRLISTAMSDNQEYIALLCDDIYAVWNIKDKVCIGHHKFTERIAHGGIFTCENGSDFIVTTEKQIVLSDLYGNIHVILSTELLFKQIDYEWKAFSSSTVIVPRFSLLVCGMELSQGTDSYPICIFDRTGKIYRILDGHNESVKFIGFDREKPIMITATENGEIKWWNTDNWICEKTLFLDNRMLSISINNGKPRFVYEIDGSIVLDDCVTRHILCDSINANTVSFSPDGTLVFIGCGLPYSLHDEEGAPVDNHMDNYVQVFHDKSLFDMIQYTKEQCKNLSFTKDECRIYHI